MTPLLLAAALAGSGSPLDAVVEHRLANGLLVLLLEDHGAPLVSSGVMYRVGARDEHPGTTGLAHYVEHMAFRDLLGFPGSEATDSVTRLGGRWTGYTWIEQTWYAETVPREALPRMLEIQARRMRDALFDPAAFERERSSVLAELHSYEDPHSLLYDAVLAASFELHPYRHNTIGWLSDVEGVTRDEAWEFYRRHYGPGRAVLVVAGDFEPEPALAEIEARFGPLPAGPPAPPRRSREPLQTGARRVEVRRPGAGAEVLIAWRAPPLADPDFAPMVLFDALLAGGKGFEFTASYAAPADSPLRRAVVGADLAEDASSDWQASLDPYVYLVRADLAPSGDLAAAEAALLRAVAEAGAREWTDAELAAARRQLERGARLDLDRLTGRTHQLAFFEIAGGYRHRLELPGRLGEVTRAQLADFAGRWLRPERATLGWFVPTPAPAADPSPPRTLESAPPVRRAAAAGPLPPADEVEVLRHTLPSGLELVMAPRAGAGLVATALRLEAGAALGDPGLAALTVEHLARLPAGAGAPPLEWSLHLEPADASPARWLQLAALALPDELEALLEELAARVTAPAPRAEAWSSLRAAAGARARQTAATPEAAAWAAALAALWPAESSRSLPAWGRADELEAAAPEALARFIAARIVPGRARLVLSGDFDPATARRLVESRFAHWTGAPTALPAAAAAPPRGGEAWSERRLPFPGRGRDEILVAWPGDRSRPADDAATRALLYLLGETYYAGRLGRALVEPGLVYSVWLELEEDGLPGFLALRTAAAPSDTPEVLKRIRAVLEQAAQGDFTRGELDEAQAYLRGKAARGRDGAVASAASLLRDEPPVAGLSLEQLSLDQLNGAARRLFRNGYPVVVVAGPGD